MADTAPAPVPTAAIGYMHAPTYTWYLDENEHTPELQWPMSLRVYDQMRRTDSQVKSVLQAVCQPVIRTPWRIDPNGARDEVVRLVADDMGLPIAGENEARPPLRSKDRFSWKDHLRLALLMLPYGFSYFEQLYRVDADGSRAHLAKLEFRPQMTVERVEVATDGGLVYIQQYWTAQDRTPQPIPVDRLVAYVYEREGGNWLGTSILRPVYKNWLLKDRLLRVQAQTIERNGMGIPVYEGAENETSLSAGLSMATSLRSGEAAGAATPFGAKLRLMGVDGTLPDAKPAVEYHDQQIARAVLAHFLNLGQQTGSWALGSTFADFFTLSLQTLADLIADITTQHVIEDLVDVNWGPDEPAPRLCFDEIGSRQQATAESLKALVDAGILHPDEPLEGATRQFYGLPPADPATATAPPSDTPGETPAPPTQTGDYSVAASRRPVHAKFDPSQPRDPHSGEWSKGGAAIGRLIKSLAKAHAGGAFQSRENPDSYMDWATVRPNGDFGLEAVGDNGSVVDFDLSPTELAGLHEALANKVATLGTPEEADDAGGYWPDGDETDGRWFDWSETLDNDHLRLDLGTPDGEGGFRGTTIDMSSLDLLDWYTALTVTLLTHHSGNEVQASRLLASMDRVQASIRARQSGPPDFDDEASWIAAAAGVDTHPGGERLKHWWVYGGGAARWSTWTELYDELKQHIKNVLKLKKTVSAWYRLRYGHNPPRHKAVHASGVSDEALLAFAEEMDENFGDEADTWDFDIDALSVALDELSGRVAAAFDPRQPRIPKGSPGAGRFLSMVEHLKGVLYDHVTHGGTGDPFEGFDREQLRRVAVKQGIRLDPGEHRDSIAAKLLDHLGGTGGDKPLADLPKPAIPRSRAARLAERQSKAGQKAAGIGVRQESPSKRARRKRIEDATNAALDESYRRNPRS